MTSSFWVFLRVSAVKMALDFLRAVSVSSCRSLSSSGSEGWWVLLLRPQVRIAQKRIIHPVGKVRSADGQGKFNNLLFRKMIP